MRRDDLAPPEAPSTLEEALTVPDLEDRDLVRSLWDDLATPARVVEPPVPSPAPPAPPAGPAVPSTFGLSSPPAVDEPIVMPDGPVVGRIADPWYPAPIRPEPAPEAPPVVLPPAEEPVAPVVAPAEPATEPRSRRDRRREQREAKDAARRLKLEKRRHRILPRTVLGIASMLLFFGLGVGIAGAALYAYYDWRLQENEERVGELSASLEQRLSEANEELATSSETAIDNIRAEAAPLRALIEEQQVAADLTGRLDGSVWFVETLDENGAASVGSAFVVASDDSQSLLLTSYSAVAAGTTEPAPAINVRSGEDRVEADLFNWDPERDLALLVVPRGGLRVLPWAGDRVLSRLVGQRVWAVQGIGGNGVSLSGGSVIDQTEGSIQHSAALNSAFRGGPLVTGEGRVVGIASTAYSPLGYPGGDVSFGVPVQDACERVLTCTGEVPGRGNEG